ncbi:hypothetical protein [Cytophaga hutchinsonii]|uniref:DUF4488 domain-containing protein n=1 Tax=Cytophaga hutchinsonii (strain ATCC 33406 / DSM 1761 / CIP 103989 / NBRC 15051 / NCIMB 9469 / D465) TaxID=269798 RepID=A0A6N4SMX1_CYTH3|nr:hypothetical protein [Cytophaga hutchinsonii]ABG57596.1 hypothetical protein CHU_0305 [Cytophaga hutchinsonii ATCC 33406]
MMNASNTLSGKWLGSFNYDPECMILYPENHPDTTFCLQLSDNSGSLTGTCIDDEVKGIMKGIITVSGFADGDIISFTKQYPCFYFMNEDGKIQIDDSKVHPPVIYSGVYDAESDTYSGEWEMTLTTENIQGECFDEIIFGSWIIRRAASNTSMQ